MNRRMFLIKSFGTAFLLTEMEKSTSAEEKKKLQKQCPIKKPNIKPWGQYHGFNFLNYFMVYNMTPFQEEEFVLVNKLGFNFIRLPMDYRCWTDENSPYMLKEEILREIDKAIKFGGKYKIHICLNFHRAPGWTVAEPKEKLNLWEDEEALKICCHHWRLFAERYKDIPPEALSFNLFNEPGNVSAEKHKRVVGKVVESIRGVDERRSIHCDGRFWGAFPPIELAEFGIVANLHMYQPFAITHYKASWAGKWDNVPVPDYPYKEGEFIWNKEGIRERVIKPWQELENKGVPVFVGEFGAYNKTPHKVVLNWMKDALDLFHEAGWGWSMWNFKGSFGPLNSDREDVQYEDWEGNKVDTQMLNLLQEFVNKKP